MAPTNEKRINVTNYPSLGPDDCMSDELPDYSSRRSSYFNDNKPTPFDPDHDHHRKISTASNMLEVPRYSLYERQNSVGSTASLVSSTSNNTFSYRNLTKPKIKNAFGGVVVLIGLCLLALGILLLIFGHTTTTTTTTDPIYTTVTTQTSGSIQQNNSSNNDKTINDTINYSNISMVYESTNNTGNNSISSTTEDINHNNYDNKVISNGYHVSAAETIGYFALFSGVLLILIGISIICLSVKEPQPKPSPQNPNIQFKRRVSTIELENLPNEVPVNKPEIMITTDSLKDKSKVSYKKYPDPLPIHVPRASFSGDDMFSPKTPTKEYQKKFQF